MANSREPIAWITVKGARVPIFDGQSREDAVKEFRERIAKHNQSNQPITQGSKDRAKRDYSSAKKQVKRTERRQDEEGNRKANERLQEAQKKYNDTKEKTGIKSVEFTRPSDRDPANKTDNEFMRRENERYEREHGKGTYKKEETQKQQRIEQARKALSKEWEEKEKQIARNEAEAKASRSQQSERVENYKALIEKYQKQGMSLEEAKERAYGVNEQPKSSNSGKTEQEMRDFLKSRGKEKFVEELSGRTEKGYKAALQYVYDQHTLGKEQFAKKYGLDNSQLRSMEASQYDKYKSGYKYENAKTVNVNGNEYKVWSDDIYRGTFAEDKNGNVLPIKQSGYLSKEVSQRKAIANAFGESSFRSKAGSTGNKISGMSKEEAMLNYKAIKISKNMPIAKQEELKRLKAQYLKIWKG